MRIKLTSIMVDDQDKALRFYTEALGFRKKHDIPVGEYQWIAVISPEGPDDLELCLDRMPIRLARSFRRRCSSKAFRLPPSR